jgi:hypothetical protein
MKTWVRRKVNALIESYGTVGTAAILVFTVALLPVPFPGTSAIPVLVAKLIRRIFSN